MRFLNVAGMTAAIFLKMTAGLLAQTTNQQIETMTNDWCAAEGHDRAFCACMKSEIDQKVRPIASSDEALLVWLALFAGGSLNPMTVAQVMQSATPSEQQAAAMIFTQVPDLGASCEAPATELADTGNIDGTPYERFMVVCIAENEDEGLCTCLADNLQEQLSADDFELMVDLRVADFQGADDPLAVVAAERGLTGAEAEEALASNTRLLSGMMAVNPMACLGEVPGLSAIPGLPAIPGVPSQ